VLDSRAWFEGCRSKFDPKLDLVLTYDFALKREVEASGGTARYVDHLLDPREMQKHNFVAYDFFKRWHLDENGRDLFEYRGVHFGSAFRLYYWSEYIFSVRARMCIEKVRAIHFDEMFVGTSVGVVETVLEEMGVAFTPIKREQLSTQPLYYFPIHAFMDENIERHGWKERTTTLITAIVGRLQSCVDRLTDYWRRKSTVFVQLYYPTTQLVQRLRGDAKVKVVGTSVPKNFLRSLMTLRYIPLTGNLAKFEPIAAECMTRYRQGRCARLVIDGIDLTVGAYATIERYVSARCSRAILTLDCAIRYLERNPIQLEVMVSNVGGPNGLIDAACKARGIPSYLIINGWLSGDFLDEAKYSTVINAYGTSIKENYFRGMNNVVCLGDPRMDDYPPMTKRKKFNPDSFTVTIGASGYNNIDLNSFTAVEFEFLFDVLTALSIVRKRGVDLKIIVKVRANGLIDQYRQFTAEYFPGLVGTLVDSVPMKKVLERSDFYISIYSQTIFEASCMGIPCLYYKKDVEILDPPFDGQSELVTVGDINALVQAIEDLRSDSERFAAFLKRSVMEKYLGPLDGKNGDRNLEFIFEILRKQDSWTVA